MYEVAECSRQGWTTGRQCWEYNNTRIFNGRGIKFALQFSVHEIRYYSSLPVPDTNNINGPEG